MVVEAGLDRSFCKGPQGGLQFSKQMCTSHLHVGGVVVVNKCQINLCSNILGQNKSIKAQHNSGKWWHYNVHEYVHNTKRGQS